MQYGTMPAAYRKVELLSHSVLFGVEMEAVHFSRLSLFQTPSGKRDPGKFDWRGYLPSGAVKAEEDESLWREFQGLPVPARLTKSLHRVPEKTDARLPCYAVAIDNIESTSLICCFPIPDRPPSRLRDPIHPSELDRVMSEIRDDTAPRHSLLADKLLFFSFPAPLVPNRRGDALVIRVPDSIIRVPASMERDIEILLLRLEMDDPDLTSSPSQYLVAPYYSVMHDPDGVLLYFIALPTLPGSTVRRPNGIVTGPGVHWRRLKRPLSMADLTVEDAATSRHPTSNDGRPSLPDTIDYWLLDR